MRGYGDTACLLGRRSLPSQVVLNSVELARDTVRIHGFLIGNLTNGFFFEASIAWYVDLPFVMTNNVKWHNQL